MKKIIRSFVFLLSVIGGASFLRAAQQTYVVGVSDSNDVTVTDDSPTPIKYNWVKYSGYSYYAFDLNGLSYNLGLVVSERTGYRFDGWFTLSSGKYGSGGPADCGEKISTDLHITWSEITTKAATSSDWNNHYLVCPKFVKVWTVSASVSPAEGGTVSGTGAVDDGATTNLVATANAGYAFDHWDGFDETSTTLTTPPIKADTAFVAVFRELKVDKPTVTKSFTYDGNAKTCATAGDHYTVSDNVKTAAGTYTFTATLKDGYHWSDGTTDPYTVQWVIVKAQNDFTEQPTITGWTYDGSPSSPTAVAKFSGSSGISYVYYDGSKVKLSGRPSDAGNYYLKATTPGSDNYTSVTSEFVSFSIAPKQINTSTISYSDKTETYDGTAKTIVVGYVPDHVTATYSNNSRTDAGSQTATVTFEPENGNYTVSTKSKTAMLKINQATISSFALVASSVIYDGEPHPPVVKSVTTANGVTFTDAAVGWTVNCNSSDFVNAGEIRVDVTGNNNLTGSAYYPQTFTISRAKSAELSVTPLSFTYDGQPHGPTLGLTHCTEDGTSVHTATDAGTYYVRATPDANHAWSDGSTSSKSIAWTISYQQVAVTYDLNYEGAPAASTRTLNYAKEYTFPAVSRTGYDFKGWWTDPEGGTEVTESTKVATKSAHSLYAHWKAKEYTLTITMDKDVRYEGNESPYTLPTKLVYDATNLNELAVVSKAGYNFQGYFLSNGTQLYDANGRNVKDVTDHWSEAYPNGVYRHDGNLSVTARFSEPIEMYTVTTEASPSVAGTVTGGGVYEKGSNVVLTATVTNPGYSFACWNRTNDNVQVSTDRIYSFPASASAGYVAVFTGNVYTVTFDGQRKFQDWETKTVTFGQPYGDPPGNFEMEGYVLIGWYTEPYGSGERKDLKPVDIPKDHTLYANWKEITDFTVTFVDPEELSNRRNPPKPVPYEKGETVSEPPSVTYGWSDKWFGEYWIAGWNPPLPQVVSSDMTITAVRESIATVLDCAEQGLVFQRNDNWQVCTDDHFAGNSCLMLGSVGGTDTVRTALPAGDGGLLTFYWKSDAGKELIVKVSQGDKDYALPNFVARNAGWNQETIEIRAGGEATVEFTCSEQIFDNSPRLIDTVSWQPGAKPSRKVTVTCGEHGKLKQGSTGAFPSGSDVTLEAEADPGYAFCCWTNDTGFATNENPWTFTVVEDVSYKATFTNAQYVVTFDPNGGTGGDASVIATYLKPLPQVTPLSPRTDGWTFNGYTNAAGVAYYDANGESAKDWDQPNAATLFAQWKAPNKYALTVKVEGRGSVIKKPDAPQYVANTTVDLEAKPDIGAAFAQWDDGEKSPTRTVTMTGDITLMATFTNCQYVVTLNPNGGNVSPTTKIVTYGETYGEDLPTPKSAGLTFAEWWTSATGGTKVEAATKVTTAADHTLYAHWEADVGPLSKALDCNNLKFEQIGGWEIGSDPALGAVNGTYVYTSTKDAILKATIEKSGILTFHYKGYASYLMTVQVLLGDGEVSDARINIEEQESYPDTWQSVDVPIQVTGDSVMLTFKCTKVDPDGCCCTLDHVTWMPDAPAHPEPTDADKVTISAAGVKDGKFTLSFASDERFDYNLLTNANLLIDSWGTMEKKSGTGEKVSFEPEIIDGLPQLFYKVETIQRQD